MKDQNDGRHRHANASDHSSAADGTTTSTAGGAQTGRTLTITITRADTSQDPGESPRLAEHMVAHLRWAGLPGFKYPIWESKMVPAEYKTEAVVPGELIGWRVWRYDKSLDRLTSVVFEHVWEPGEPMHGPHDGECFGKGVHANKTLRQLKHNYSPAFSMLEPFAFFGYEMLYGQVALWGDVMEHERGYRAEYAKPISLYWTGRWSYFSRSKRELLASLREKYLGKT